MAKKPFEDDGRTIADMSGVENHSTSLFGRLPRSHRSKQQTDAPTAPPLTKEQSRIAIRGALLAALLIGGVFIAAGAIAIAVMLAIWT